jgi:hypothetical protein
MSAGVRDYSRTKIIEHVAGVFGLGVVLCDRPLAISVRDFKDYIVSQSRIVFGKIEIVPGRFRPK